MFSKKAQGMRNKRVAKAKKNAWEKRGEKGKKLRLKREGNPEQPWEDKKKQRKWQRKWMGKHKPTVVEEDNHFDATGDDDDWYDLIHHWEVCKDLSEWD
jgi:hypothetical protein